jgi:hypothetical protein
MRTDEDIGLRARFAPQTLTADERVRMWNPLRGPEPTPEPEPEPDENQSKATELQQEVARALGVKPELAHRLKGGTREELEADVERIVEQLGDSVRSEAPAGRPRGRGGDGGASMPAGDDVRDLRDAFFPHLRGKPMLSGPATRGRR